MKVISIENLSVYYDDLMALGNVNLEIESNQFIGVIGPNGGGKTTLVKTLLGLIKPTKGEVKLGANQVLGYVPQLTTFDREFPITVREVILMGHLKPKIRFGHRFSNHDKTCAKDVMFKLGIDHLSRRQIGKLSGGQLQKVLIARALMNHPTILVLDEPTAGVDEGSRKEIYEMLSKLSDEMTILMISHDTNDLFNHVDKLVYINKTAHIHEKETLIKPNLSELEDCCPIDWFVEGERIHKELLDQRGEVL